MLKSNYIFNDGALFYSKNTPNPQSWTKYLIWTLTWPLMVEEVKAVQKSCHQNDKTVTGLGSLMLNQSTPQCWHTDTWRKSWNVMGTVNRGKQNKFASEEMSMSCYMFHCSSQEKKLSQYLRFHPEINTQTNYFLLRKTLNIIKHVP